MPVFSDMEAHPSTTAAPAATQPQLDGLCVLASGSRGNCSVLRVTISGTPRHYLIDLGLSPRRTKHELAKLGLTLEHIEAVLLTHLDIDHCHCGWCGVRAHLPPHVEVFLPKSHLGRSRRMGLKSPRLCPFNGSLHTPAGIPIKTMMSAHDDLGAAVFRIDTPVGMLGFATDLGRVTSELIEHLRGVDVLAIESNYCPELELSSGRPRYLIQRIMGGRGHLSNHEAVEAIRLIQPRDHVVLLHLSEQCNRPSLVRSLHEKLGHRFTVASQTQPTGWIALRRRCDVAVRPRAVDLLLFS